MSIADNLSPEETQIMQDMQANEPEEKEIIREEKIESTSSEPDDVELRPEVKALIEPEAAKEEPKLEEKAKEETKRLVPLSELQEERRSRKEAQDAARIAQERMDILLQRFAPPPEPVKPPADVDQDPIGAVKEMKAELEQLRQFRQQQDQVAQQTQYFNQIKEVAKTQEAEYVKDNPDYVEAGNYLMNQRIGQLKAMGYNDIDAKRHMAQESLNLAQMAIQNGKSVPQMIDELAKNSGFTPKPKVAPPADKIDNVARGMKANVSLSNANGSTNKASDINGAAIAKMSEADFSKLLDKMSGAERQAMLGR